MADSSARIRRLSFAVFLAIGVSIPAVFAGTIQNFNLTPVTFPAGTALGPVGPMTVGSDGNLYVLDSAHLAISRVTPPHNTVTPFPIPSDDFFNLVNDTNFIRTALAGTPDGKIWFTEILNGVVGFVDPADGSFQKFTIAQEGSGNTFDFIQAIGAGPDGNLWFGESGAVSGHSFANVGNVTPAGRVTRYHSPINGGNFGGITTGPDGNVWATLSHVILRVKPSSGAVDVFTPPTFGFLDTITTGPDHNLWTTETNTSKVLRITPAGAMTEFATPDASAQAVGITAGSDGNMWFLEQATGKIVRMNLAAAPTGTLVPAGLTDLFDTADAPGGLTPEFIEWLEDIAFDYLDCPSPEQGHCTEPGGLFETGECVPPTISPATIPRGKVGSVFSQTFDISGGKPPYTIYFGSFKGLLPDLDHLPDGLTAEISEDSVTISGRPTQSGSYPIGIVVADADDCRAAVVGTLIIDPNCPPMDLAPPTLPDGTIGKGYGQKIIPTAGLSTGFTFEVSGNLPPGVTATQTDAAVLTLSGTPTRIGDYEFKVTATDAFGCKAPRSYKIHVGSCPDITIHPASLPNASQNKPYNFGVAASGGTPPYTYGATGLPAGMTIDPATGAVTGGPQGAGPFNITIMATDSRGCTGTKTYKLTVKQNCLPITIDVVGGPNATLGKPYTATYSATGGTPPYTFTGATAAPGLAFNGPVLAGVPTMTGFFPVFIGVTDANGCPGTEVDFVRVLTCPPFTISPAILPAALLGALYFQPLGATGGVPPYTFIGAAPAGLILFPNGAIGGVPSTAAGPLTFAITVVDSAGCSDTANITMDVVDCISLAIGPATLPAGLKGQAFSQTLSASGGVVPYHYSTVINGTLPPGLTISSSSGKISGTPTADGTFGFSVIATDSKGCHVTQDYTVVIDSAPTPNLFVTKTADVTTANRGDTITYVITISNPGTAPTSGTWTATDLLPPGLSVASSEASSGSGLSCQTGATKTGAAVVCSSTTALPVGSSATITIVTTVSETASPGPAVNSVSLFGGAERREDDDQASATVEIVLPRSSGGVSGIAPAHPARVGKPTGR